MRILRLITSLAVSGGLLFAGASPALAAMPHYTAITNGSGIQVTVSGADPNSQVDFYGRANNSGSWTTVTNVGRTDWSGSYNGLVNPGFPAGVTVTSYVMVNGQQSGVVTVSGTSYNPPSPYPCDSYSCGHGQLTFSNNNVSLRQGQSMAVSIYGQIMNYLVPYGSNYYYVSSNSNSSAVSASISGNTLNLYGNNPGSSTVIVCSTYGGACGSVYVVVSGNYGSGLTFSDDNIVLRQGQSQALTIYGPGLSYRNYFYVSNNSNSNAVSASISGDTLNLYGSATGSSTITVCTDYRSYCGTLYVTVRSGSTTGDVTFSANSLDLRVGQAATVYAYGTVYASDGYNNQFYIFRNSNPNVAGASISGNAITVSGNRTGNTTLTVCVSGSGRCGTLPVRVGSSNRTRNPEFLTTSLPAGTLGQFYDETVRISGGDPYYTFRISSGNLPDGLRLVYSLPLAEPTSSSTTIATGSVIVTGTPTVSGTYRFTIEAMDQNGRTARQTFTLTVRSGGTTIGTYSNGALVVANGTIYQIYRNMKIGFASNSAFSGLGYRLSSATYVDNLNLPDAGQVVTTQFAPHPWGSWVVSGNTIYFVHQQGLIPISSYDIFINNGGQLQWLLPMNSYDSQLPQLSLMTLNDPRLR